MLNIVYGRALLIRKEYHLVIGSQEKLLEIASVFSNLLGQIHTFIYIGGAYWRLLREEEAVDSVRKALELALADGMLIPFVENMDYIEPVLTKIANETVYRDFVGRIL